MRCRVCQTGHTTSATEKSVQRFETDLPGVCVIQSRVVEDTRGFFPESYHQLEFAKLSITDLFVQDNHSVSGKGVLRALHYQLCRPQAKLCRVVEGEVLDVAVDIRLGSPHFGKWVSVALSARNGRQIYVPKGFAHGFLALSESVQFLYKCNDFYDPADEYGILWNDPDLNIAWGVTAPPVLSQKDRRHSRLAEVPRKLLPRYQP